jgi:MarR family 2-MHQ and catechol resistance regulon transcriptional repressor
MRHTGRKPNAVPATIPEHELRARHAIIALMKAADGARQAMTRSLEAFELTLPQFNVLTILLHHDELPTFQVAARMVEATPGITRLMDTLHAKGFVQRVQCAGDRRRQLCALTPAGRRVVEAAIPGFSLTQQDLLRELGKSDVAKLTALLQRMKPPEKSTRGRRVRRQAAP